MRGRENKKRTASYRYKIPNIYGLCKDGNEYDLTEIPVIYEADSPECGMCHVVIPDQWFKRMYVSAQEQVSIGSLPHLTPETNSRLSCCIKIQDYMQEMIVYAVGKDSLNIT